MKQASQTTLFCAVICLMALSLKGCLGMPERISPVSPFELDRYLGTWYEVARLDHSFERGLSKVTAHYSLRDDGGVDVLNRGYSEADGQWSEAQGKAYFVEDDETGYLKVSFFGPFYGSYVVFELDKADYQYAFVSGPDTSYLWLLSRQPTVPDALKDRFIDTARQKGFETSELVFVEHALPH